MKYNSRINPIQAVWPKPSALAAAILLLTAPAFQAFSQSTPPPETLAITENSSTSLTVLWNGASITPNFIGSDHWSFTLPIAMTLAGESGEASWIEPENDATYNDVVVDTAPTSSPAIVEVFSDAKPGGTAPIVGDGVIVLGGDVSNERGIDVTFNDNGDAGTGTVPDSASTALLALPAILALFAMARLRKSSVPV